MAERQGEKLMTGLSFGTPVQLNICANDHAVALGGDGVLELAGSRAVWSNVYTYKTFL